MKFNDYDLVVVGTGFASSFFLRKYLNKLGSAPKKILVLEKGFNYPHSERLKFEQGLPTDFNTGISPWYENIVNENKKKIWQFSTAFGGSSNCWWGCTPRFMPSDFRLSSLYGVAQDWPITYSDLDAYYYEAEELMFVSGPEETPFPRKGKYPLPPHTFTVVDQVLHAKYGDLYISQPTARASKPVPGRNSCMAYSTCHTCPVNAKFTIENGNLGVYTDTRVEVQYGCSVYSLEILNDMVRKVLFHKDGKDHSVSGEVIVLGANPFFNANILLNAGDKNPLVGKGVGEQLGMQAQIYLDGMKNVGGSNWVNANGYMFYDGIHRKEYAACLIEVNNAPHHIRTEKGKHLNVASFRLVFEDLPVNDNYVTTSEDRLKPKVYFNHRSEYALKGIENLKRRLPEVLSCLPVERILYSDIEPNEGHIIGGTPMSQSKLTGVVDKHLIHHQYRNLIVLGAGVFPTYGPSNPTLTLTALSLFSADKLF